MLPAFRSNASVLSFCGLLTALLLLPLATNWVGHPPREQAYAGMTAEAGPVGTHVREIFRDPVDADIIFLGSSLVRAGVDPTIVEKALSEHLGRPAHVVILSLNWQGLDLQYFMLRDYLQTHHAKLVVWNLPAPGSRNVEPHVEAFRWLRYGEYTDAMSGLPLRYKMAIYGDMVLGAPRELLSHIRPNRLGDKELSENIVSEPTGYYGKRFVPETIDSIPIPTLDQTYEPPPYPLLHVAGKPLNAYESHFAKEILALTKEKNVPLALLHIPIDTERGRHDIPERSNWASTLHIDAPLLGEPSASLFQDVNSAQAEHFYRDQHFNANGSKLFTRSILPALLKAYDTGAKP